IMAVLTVMTSCAASLPEKVPSILVPQVDLKRYAGLWYQVARYPHSFQRGECGVSTAEYTLEENGRISVLNRCWDKEYGGTYSQQVRATAKPKNPEGSWLRVWFFGLFPANYLIIELDEENYAWAAVTTPKKNTLWILSRTPALDTEIYNTIVNRLEEKGFDSEKIIKTSLQK
ncbi:MAG: lipocalin family protein, partial [Spirochaetales bacterium]|nr:lipocalin family protein [Spirochaetales bacterium]